MDQKRKLNQDAFKRMRDQIRSQYPHGRYLAIADGAVAAEAATFDALCATLDSLGKNPRETLIVQAGVEYPERATIFLA
ncbi:MAG: hypothetical protein HY040_21460 [Planctomycetes bacterium]|nr:hypothetical protein [Planctomycetota bacterium]